MLEKRADTLIEPLVVNGVSVAEAVGIEPEPEDEDDGVPVELEPVEWPQVRFLNNVAVSNTDPSLDATNSFVT